MDRFFRNWWLGIRIFFYVGLAWVIASLPLAIGRAVFPDTLDSQSPFGVILLVAGVLYALIVFPVLFAALCFPLPTIVAPQSKTASP